MAGGDRHNARQAAAVALAGGAQVQTAAKKAGVSERTLYRWLRDPNFQQAVAEIRRQAVDQAVGLLAHGSAAAALTLCSLLQATSEGVRLRAALGVLQAGSLLRQEEDLAQRVHELEQAAVAIAEGKQNGALDVG